MKKFVLAIHTLVSIVLMISSTTFAKMKNLSTINVNDYALGSVSPLPASQRNEIGSELKKSLEYLKGPVLDLLSSQEFTSQEEFDSRLNRAMREMEELRSRYLSKLSSEGISNVNDADYEGEQNGIEEEQAVEKRANEVAQIAPTQPTKTEATPVIASPTFSIIPSVEPAPAAAPESIAPTTSTPVPSEAAPTIAPVAISTPGDQPATAPAIPITTPAIEPLATVAPVIPTASPTIPVAIPSPEATAPVVPATPTVPVPTMPS